MAMQSHIKQLNNYKNDLTWVHHNEDNYSFECNMLKIFDQVCDIPLDLESLESEESDTLISDCSLIEVLKYQLEAGITSDYILSQFMNGFLHICYDVNMEMFYSYTPIY